MCPNHNTRATDTQPPSVTKASVRVLYNIATRWRSFLVRGSATAVAVARSADFDEIWHELSLIM